MDERIRSNDALGLGDPGALPAEPPRVNLNPLEDIVQALASVALGMTFIMASPASMLLIWFLWDSRFRDFSRLDVVLIAICGFLGCVIILVSAGFGLVFGITATLTARRHHRPAALGVAGVLLSGFCLPLWIFITILWAFAIGSRI